LGLQFHVLKFAFKLTAAVLDKVMHLQFNQLYSFPNKILKSTCVSKWEKLGIQSEQKVLLIVISKFDEKKLREFLFQVPFLLFNRWTTEEIEIAYAISMILKGYSCW
jgi:hypothetical protein